MPGFCLPGHCSVSARTARPANFWTAPWPGRRSPRWHKLLKSFYSEKKDRFDISKVPDIYDSAKYDAIHNAHLGLEVLEVRGTAASPQHWPTASKWSAL